MEAEAISSAPSAPELAREELRALFEQMVRVRTVDARLAALGDAGRVGFLPRALGREAALAGALHALEAGDWLFPTHGDWPVALLRGMDAASFAHRVFGTASDPLKGRDIPSGLSAKGLKIASVSAPAATHLPHAVGLAWSARQRGEALVSAALFDGPEVDAADFHTGVNFAGVMKAPTLFLCRVKDGEPGAAEHAVAYGVAATRCDATDLREVIAAVREARERALSGDGATLIDLVVGGDDAAMDKARAELGSGDLDEAAIARRVEEELASAIDAASRASEPALGTLFSDVYEAIPPHLDRQRDEIVR
ncbi:MAG: thiamine pyrophosphate-dependent dehydrogenase E1 component subunit alpha [Sandaracinaceae bacterium]|nr:hypothetical protein [Myxococcales bacterium]